MRGALMEDKLILMLDDDPKAVETVSEYFKLRGITVKGVGNPEDLLTSLETDSPVLILLDIVFENRVINGFDVCREIKDSKKFSNVPVIILSAKVSEGDRVQGLSLGAEDYLVKPFSLKELECKVNSIIQREEKLKEIQQLEEKKSRELEEKIQKLRMLTKSAINREDRMAGLKREINELLKKTGKPPEYA